MEPLDALNWFATFVLALLLTDVLVMPVLIDIRDMWNGKDDGEDTEV